MCQRVLLVATAALAAFLTNPAAAQQAMPVRIGMARSFVPDQPRILVDIAMGEFKTVLKQTAELAGDVNARHTALEIADKLNDKQMEFGILYAHEFAWARKKYPDLQPLLIAAVKNPDKRVHLVVHKNNQAKTLADLRGKKLDMPYASKEYCRIYLEKSCLDKTQSAPDKLFASIAKSPTQVAALDQVARGEADATLVDTPWLDFYKQIKGSVYDKNLKVLEQSAVVPPAVLAYKQGALPQATRDQLAAGLRKAHMDTRGRALMGLWHIDSFELVPEDYLKSLDQVLKEYPPPATRAKLDGD